MDKNGHHHHPGTSSTSKRSHNLFNSIINLAPLGRSRGIISSLSSPPPPQPSQNITTISNTSSISSGGSGGGGRVRNPDNGSINNNVEKRKSQKQGEEQKMNSVKMGAPHSSTNTTNMSRSSAGSRTPPGPGPRTFSILSALNELSIFDKVVVPSSHSQPPQNNKKSKNNNNNHNTTTTTCSQTVLLSRNIGSAKQRKSATMLVPHEIPPGFLPTSFPPPPAFLHTQQSCDQVRREEKLGTSRCHNHRDGWCHRERSSSSSRRRRRRGGEKVLTGNEQIKSNTPKPPEWIQKIFQLTKSGRLDELKVSLDGLDPTMIRHLATAKGKNLLHCAAHLETLQLLISNLGPLADAALKDQDENGCTPIQKALKRKRLDLLKWLVLETDAGRNALIPPENKEQQQRSLLHFASFYGNLVAVQWLTQVLVQRGISIDLIDMSNGMTPLCEAAKSGKVLVCHELILNGANPLHQTPLGRRPLHFSLHAKQMECANYLIMVETSASIGAAFHLRLKEFQALAEEHDSLRNHFRELLRVGKWLAKERTDLIKNFSSIGSTTTNTTTSITTTTTANMSLAEGCFLLLGESSGSGTRFSDMEHKLGQAEQAWMNLRKNSVTVISDTEQALIANGDAFNLQEMLAAAQLRCNTTTTLEQSRGSSEEEEDNESRRCGCPTSVTSTSSSDVDDDDDDEQEDDDNGILLDCGADFDSNKNLPKQELSWSQNYRARQKRDKSGIAPWLLLPSHDCDAELSPLVSQLDLLETPPISRTYNGGAVFFNQNSSEYSTTHLESFCHETENPDSLAAAPSPSQPTIVEVIQPNLVSIKGPPDLIRESTRNSSSSSAVQDQQHSRRQLQLHHHHQNHHSHTNSKNYAEIDDTIYSEIRPPSSGASSSLNKRDSGKCVPNSVPPIIANSFFPNKCQNHQSCCDTDVPPSSIEQSTAQLRHPSSSPLGKSREGAENCRIPTTTGSLCSNNPPNIDHSCKSGGSNGRSNGGGGGVGGMEKASFKTNPDTRSESRAAPIPIDSTTSTTLTFPVQVSTPFPVAQLTHHHHHPLQPHPCDNINASTSPEDISYCNNESVPLLHLEEESISALNTPVMQRSFSSFSHSPSTVLFPIGGCGSSAGGCDMKRSLMNEEEEDNNNHYHRLHHHQPVSPTPSETSHTESALAPPPSHSSSGGSNTESAREVSHLILEEEEAESVVLLVGAKNHVLHDSQIGQQHPQPTNDEAVPKQQLDKTNQLLQSILRPPPASAAVVGIALKEKMVHEEGPPFVSSSSRIHEGTPSSSSSIHYVTKTGRRQRKAWYEIEPSDEDEEGGGGGGEEDRISFLKTRPQRSSSSSGGGVRRGESGGCNNNNNNNTTTKSHQLSVSSNHYHHQEDECDPSSGPQENCEDFV